MKTREVFSMLICILTIGIIFSGNNANALDWNDPSWKQAGRPDNLKGRWKRESNASKGSLWIEDRFVFIPWNDRGLKAFPYKENLLANQNQLIELEIMETDSEVPPFKLLQFRPHLVTKSGKREEGSWNCLVKMFRYQTTADASKDKYLTWDIYRKKD